MKTKTDNKTAYCQNSEMTCKCQAISCHDKKNYRHYTSGEFPTDSQSRGRGVNDALTGGSSASEQSSPHATPLQARNADLKGEKECREVLRLPKEMNPRLITVSNGIDQCTLHHLKRQEDQAITAGHLAAQGRSRCALATIEAVQVTPDLHTSRCGEPGRHGVNQGQQVHGISATACPRGREQAQAVLQRMAHPSSLWGTAKRQAAAAPRPASHSHNYCLSRLSNVLPPPGVSSSGAEGSSFCSSADSPSNTTSL